MTKEAKYICNLCGAEILGRPIRIGRDTHFERPCAEKLSDALSGLHIRLVPGAKTTGDEDEWRLEFRSLSQGQFECFMWDLFEGAKKGRAVVPSLDGQDEMIEQITARLWPEEP